MTCLAASEAHSVIISGSLDQTCILWDLEDLGYITQLPEHSSGVSALAINDLTVSINAQNTEVSLHFSPWASLRQSHRRVINWLVRWLVQPAPACGWRLVWSVSVGGCWNSPRRDVWRKGGHFLPFRPVLILKQTLNLNKKLTSESEANVVLHKSESHAGLKWQACLKKNITVNHKLLFLFVLGWDRIVRRHPFVPLDHEGPAAGLHRRLLRARGKHPVLLLYSKTRVGPPQRYHHWLRGRRRQGTSRTSERAFLRSWLSWWV